MLNEWISSIVSKRFARFLSHKPKLMLNHFKEYFSFSKKELNGLLVFCILLLLVVIAPSVYYWLHPAKAYDYKQFQAEVESFRKSEIRTLKAELRRDLERARPSRSEHAARSRDRAAEA